LSDILKVDPTFGYIPDFVGDVSSLGASLLVYAMSNLFQNSMTGRKPLSSLENLVSRLSVFQVTEPRDTIYALLAIAKEIFVVKSTTLQTATPYKLPPRIYRLV
jgi:hypothetical protein